MSDDELFEATDLIDLALLGGSRDDPLDLDRSVDRARALCAPWLLPTTEVVEGRIAALLVRGWLHFHRRTLVLTDQGGAAFARLMQRPLRTRTHEVRFCLENLKLSFLDLVDEGERAAIGRELLAARRRCLACIGGLADSCGADRPAVQACLSLRRRLMTAELEIMAEALALPG